jgi:hypothetical protein
MSKRRGEERRGGEEGRRGGTNLERAILGIGRRVLGEHEQRQPHEEAHVVGKV